MSRRLHLDVLHQQQLSGEEHVQEGDGGVLMSYATDPKSETQPKSKRGPCHFWLSKVVGRKTPPAIPAKHHRPQRNGSEKAKHHLNPSSGLGAETVPKVTFETHKASRNARVKPELGPCHCWRRDGAEKGTFETHKAIQGQKATCTGHSAESRGLRLSATDVEKRNTA